MIYYCKFMPEKQSFKLKYLCWFQANSAFKKLHQKRSFEECFI